MADQKRWFKVWTSILSDDDFDPGRGLNSIARFVMLGAYTALHGSWGVVEIMPDTLFRLMQIDNLSDLRRDLACKNITFEEGKNRHGKITVTWAKWTKYQEDSTQSERAKTARAKRRREEKRGEETRRDTLEPVENDTEMTSLQSFVEDWNSEFKNQLPSVQLPLSQSRTRKLKLRLQEHPEEEFWNTVFTNIDRSPFLQGNGKTGWRCTLDFLIANDSNCVKIAEGNYAEEKKE